MTNRLLPALGCVGILAGLVGEGQAASVAAGSTHSAVVGTTNGTVWGCGTNTNGQLGDASTTLRRTPVQASGLSAVAMVADQIGFLLPGCHQSFVEFVAS